MAEDIDLQKMLEDAVATALKPVTDKVAAPKEEVTPQPVKVKLFGTEREFANMDAYNKAVEDTLTQQQQRLAEVQAAAEKANSGRQVTGNDAPKDNFDISKYTALVDSGDIKAAEDYRLGQLLFDGRMGGLAGLNSYIQKQEAIEKTVAATQFRTMNPDFDPKFANVVDGIRNSLNLPYTVDGLDAAYQLAKSRGLATPVPAQATEKKAVSAPPSIQRGAAEMTPDDQAMIDNLWQMPLDKLEGTLKNMEAARLRGQ